MTEYSVYCHTTPSGRKYVGISCSPEKRWNSGKGYQKNYLFYRAINKYGWDNIKHEILYDGLSLADAKSMEKRLIAEWNFTDPEYGLNLTGGGDGLLSDTTRILMSKASKGHRRNVGQRLPDKTKKMISESLREYYSVHENPFKGRHHTEKTKQKLRNRVVSDETRKRMRKNHNNVSGEHNPSARAVIQLSLDGDVIEQYPYAKMASEKYNLDLSSLIKCCRGKIKTCGGFKWQYAPGVYGWDEVI